ncbi:MAG: ATP-binding protein [Desulfobacterales bacterium]
MASFHVSLRNRIYLLLTGILLITFSGGFVLVWYTYSMQDLLAAITEKNMASLQTAQSLETALVSQKGFVSYYFLDSDPDWLRQLGEYRQIFKERLETAKQEAQSEAQRQAVNRIEEQYNRYIDIKDRVIADFMAGERKTDTALLHESRDEFFKILNLCERYKEINARNVRLSREKSAAQAEQLRALAYSAILIELLLAAFLAYVLVIHILTPVRQLIIEAEREKPGHRKNGDEINALSRSVRGLIDNVDQTKSELRRSRETLQQAEKMALVGRLAAGMAHSIRNPFTSVKMRLFSLNRSLELNEEQEEDFDVISAEIRHIDTIVQNFLEFSRPPKLQMQSISPSNVVDSTIQLLGHRLRSYDVQLKIERSQHLPVVSADPEQLKEVLVNIIVNACEVMGKGGTITIQEEVVRDDSKQPSACIKISDTGPGIPSNIIEKILQPFFTTKEQGTGLGLSIAARIITEHGGRIDVSSIVGHGATFLISLPVKGELP